MQKEPKKSSPARCSAGRAGQRTWRVWCLVNCFRYWIDRMKWLLRAFRNIERRCLFRLHSFKMQKSIKDEKEGAGNFPQGRNYSWIILQKVSRGIRKTTTIVDVDDKNCLAQSTVALKLNHGVRQRLYIVAGVLFFVTFFCTSKRK